MPSFLHPIRTIFSIFLDALTFIKLCFRPTTTVAAENLFLRKQLGLFIERKAIPRRATDAIRFTLARLSCLFDWRNALTIVNRYLDRLASPRLPIVLETQVPTSWTTSHSRPVAEAHCRDGNEQSDLGRGAHCRRTMAQDWHPDFTTHCSALHAEDAETRSNAG